MTADAVALNWGSEFPNSQHNPYMQKFIKTHVVVVVHAQRKLVSI